MREVYSPREFTIMHKYAVMGLGYVGLELAVTLGQKNNVYAFDINKDRIKQLKQGYDANQLIGSPVIPVVCATYVHKNLKRFMGFSVFKFLDYTIL